MTIEVVNLTKTFGPPSVDVLKGINLTIENGELISIVGRSGSGKSTLLYVISTLDSATTGDIFYDQQNITTFNEKKIHLLRNKEIGFVFQFHYLLPELTVLENVLLPSYKNNLQKEKRDYALSLINEVGLSGKEQRRPGQISGGEQQRVAIARALLMEPNYLFADEPTGNLDTQNGDKIMALFHTINQKKNTTIVYVTHDLDYANQSKRKIELVDGILRHESTDEFIKY
ncbi:MAG: ABC transporter ATP-binding protein [Bacteriovorax sp.]|nr:ABC transporter ATP-binding protein [Bacteriovorax sp.]